MQVIRPRPHKASSGPLLQLASQDVPRQAQNLSGRRQEQRTRTKNRNSLVNGKLSSSLSGQTSSEKAIQNFTTEQNEDKESQSKQLKLRPQEGKQVDLSVNQTNNPSVSIFPQITFIISRTVTTIITWEHPNKL